MRDIQEIIYDIQEFQFGDSSETRLSSLAAELEEHVDAHAAVRPILRLFERFPDEDFGTPGPLVHFIEGFYGKGYEAELAMSLTRRPTALTVWLANRIANANDDNSTQFINLLGEVAERADLERAVRTDAQHFVDLQRR